MIRPKKVLARLVAGAGLTLFSLVGVAGPAAAGTVTTAACTAGGGTIVDHGAWTGCHGQGFGSSGTKIVD